MRKWTIAAGMVLGLLTLSAAASLIETRDEAVKEVMKAAMKGGLCKRVISGEGSESDKKDLLGMFEQLSKAKPPQGDASSWKDKTGALVSAARAVVDGKADGGALLKKAATCKACHDVHKGQ